MCTCRSPGWPVHGSPGQADVAAHKRALSRHMGGGRARRARIPHWDLPGDTIRFSYGSPAPPWWSWFSKRATRADRACESCPPWPGALRTESLPTRPWQRPGFGCTLCHGDPGSAAPAIRTPHPSCTRLGRLRARLSTTAAHHNATLSGGAPPPRDVPRPSHRERSYGLRCAVVGGEGPASVPTLPGSLRTDSLGYGVTTVATSGCSRSRVRVGASAPHATRAVWPRSPPTSPITCCLTFPCDNGS